MTAIVKSMAGWYVQEFIREYNTSHVFVSSVYARNTKIDMLKQIDCKLQYTLNTSKNSVIFPYKFVTNNMKQIASLSFKFSLP